MDALIVNKKVSSLGKEVEQYSCGKKIENEMKCIFTYLLILIPIFKKD